MLFLLQSNEGGKTEPGERQQAKLFDVLLEQAVDFI